jgi:nitrogen PTS system EIIA component
MKIKEFLSPADVLIDVAASDKRKLLAELSAKAAAKAGVQPDAVLAELMRREDLGSTGVGGGVAIPHARFHEIARPHGILVRLRRPIDFDAVDNKSVDIVFLLLLPEAGNRDRLGALAAITRKLRDPAIATTLRGARDSAQLYEALAAD